MYGSGTEGGRMNEANNQQPEGCIRVCVCVVIAEKTPS